MGLFILLFLNLYREQDKTERYVKAVVIWTLLLTGITLMWSLFYRLNAYTLAASCLLLDVILVVRVIRNRKWPAFRLGRPSLSLVNVFLLGEILLFLAVFYYALKSVPYNWDSMTYHLARIANWSQNQSVLPYATHIERQIASPVLGAYVNLSVYMLGGSHHDGLMNLLQCLSYGTNAVLLAGIARRIGLQKNMALLASLFYLCMPIALAEATTTQVDNFSAMWLLAFIYLMFPLVESEKPLEWNKTAGERILYGAASVALGYLAKPSVCFAMLLFLVWLFLLCLKRKARFWVMGKYLLVAAAVLGMIVLPGMLFNAMAFGTMAHSAVGQRQLVGTWRPQYVLINFLKNFTFNLASEKVETTRILIERFLYAAAGFMKLDLNDPAISEDGQVFAFPDFPALNCDVALNMFLLTVSLLLFIWYLIRRKHQGRLGRGFSVYAVVSFLVFCAALRWERFINRYMIGYFALLSLFVAIQVSDMGQKLKKQVWRLLCLFLAAGCLVNYYREIQYLRELAPFTKERGYFAYHDSNREEYPALVKAIQESGSRSVGLIIGGNTYEYPIWGMLGDDYEIRHIMVENGTGKYEKAEFVPDCILMERYETNCIRYHGKDYHLAAGSGDGRFGLYLVVPA
ncbi:hypothetical protein IMSAGC019_00833 [Lachnospiraceae bacterium]|nr:hypothetical protein IMSAGC019_00833 [Lachnospiraceae bacterium]